MQIKVIMSRGLGLGLLCLSLLGCSSDEGNSTNMAEQVGTGYYQALKNNNFDKAADFFMDTKNKPRAMWLDQIKENHQKLGDLKSFKLVGHVVNTVYSGTRYTLKYRTQYSKADAYETLILFDGVSTFGGGKGGNILLIESMLIRSKGL